jgi:acetyl-CoA/propionyl-CoA carboxylase biotin carboxyl carrier protein
MPSGPGVRVDAAIEAGDHVPSEYDPLIAKLIVHAENRPSAIARLRRAVDEAVVGGIQTTLPFHRAMLGEPAFVEATDLSTTWVDTHWDGPRARAGAVRAAALAAGLAALDGDRPPAGGGPADPGPAAAEPPSDRTSAWRTGGRSLAADRWPA